MIALLFWFVVALLLGLGLGYAWGFNVAAHPNKVSGQLSALWGRIKALW